MSGTEQLQDTVVISRKEYNEMKKDQEKLWKLEAGGVDNWDGYDWCFEGDDDE